MAQGMAHCRAAQHSVMRSCEERCRVPEEDRDGDLTGHACALACERARASPGAELLKVRRELPPPLRGASRSSRERLEQAVQLWRPRVRAHLVVDEAHEPVLVANLPATKSRSKSDPCAPMGRRVDATDSRDDR